MLKTLLAIGLLLTVSCYSLVRMMATPTPPPPPTWTYPTAPPMPTPTPLAIIPWDNSVEVDTPYTCLTWSDNLINIRTGDVLDAQRYFANNPPTATLNIPNPYLTPNNLNARIEAPNGLFAVYREDEQVYVDLGDDQANLIDNESRYYVFTETVWWSNDSRYVLYVDTEASELTAFDTVENELTLFDTQTRTLRQVGFVSHPNRILGWSATSQYFAMLNGRTIEVWHVDDGIASLDRVSNPTFPLGMSWSPDGNVLAFVSNSDQDAQFRYVNFMVMGSDNFQYPIAQITSSPLFITWSPDSLYVAVHYGTELLSTSLRVNLYSINGSVAPISLPFADYSLPNGTYPEALWVWGSYGVVTWASDAPNMPYTLYYYDFGDGIQTTLATELHNVPVVSPDGDRLSLYLRTDDGYAMDILILNDQLTAPVQQRIPFVSGASDMGNAFWSGTGEWVAVTWAQGTDDTRNMHLTWMRRDGTSYQDLSAGYGDIRDLVWAPNGVELIYIANRDGEDIIEAINLETRETRTIAQGHGTLNNLTYEAETGYLYFDWADEPFTGFARYDVDGTQIESAQNPVIIIRNATQFTEFYWSPDFDYAAIKDGIYSETGESFAIYNATQDETIVIREDLSGLGIPLWSPDGELIAFTQAIGRDPASLQVVTTDGTQVWSMPNFNPLYTSLTWIACE